MVFWLPRKRNKLSTKVPPLMSLPMSPAEAKKVLGLKAEGASTSNVPRNLNRRAFLRRAGLVAVGVGVAGGVSVNVYKREKIVSARSSLLKSMGVTDAEQWARAKTPIFEPLERAFAAHKGNKLEFSVSKRQAKGMNVVSDLAECVYHGNVAGSKPSVDDLETMVSTIRAQWPLAIKNKEGAGEYIFGLRHSLELEERRAGEALDLLLLNPSFNKKAFANKQEEIETVRQFIF